LQLPPALFHGEGQITDTNINSAAEGWSDNNDPMDEYGHISDWDTSSITNMDEGTLRQLLCDFDFDVTVAADILW
jgi:hypothetical protein